MSDHGMSMRGTASTVTRAKPETAERNKVSDPVWLERLLVFLLGVAVWVLWLSAPYRGDLWWSDASRHAMDGAFYRDLFQSMPLGHLKEYAMSYYLQYPALSTLFYPPLFPLVEAVFFAVFGVSHWSALLAVAAFYFAVAWGAYSLARRWLEPVPAFSASLLFVVAHEMALWGRQVMLEIPACAFLIWSCVAFLRYLDQGTRRRLYLVVVLLAAAAYTKQTVLFIVPAFVYILWLKRGWAIVKDRQLLAGAAVLIALLLPLACLNLAFAGLNVGSVTGGHWNAIPVFSIRGWTYYARRLPSQTNKAVAALGAIALAIGVLRKRWRGEAFLFCGAWLACGYVFFSLIALKEPRHTVVLLFPIAFLAVYCIVKLTPQRMAPVLALGLAALSFADTLFRTQVPYMTGYRQAVAYIAAHAPANGVVLFSGYRDGAFIFDLRSREDRRDVAVVRADKLLLKVAQRRELGVEERPISESGTAEMLNQYGVSYVVDQPNFWDDLKNMQQLQRVLHSKQFRLVATMPIGSNVPHADRQLEIYENLGPINTERKRIRMELPIVGVTVEGVLGGRAGK